MNQTSAPSEAAPRPSLPRNVKVLGLASLLNDVASEMIFPLLPSFLLTVLRGNLFYLGVIEGGADSVSSLVKLWSGGRSDQSGGRKGFVVFGYSITVLARPVIGLIVSPWQLFGLRVVDRIGKGIRTSPRDALIADSTDPQIRGRAFGFHRAMDHLGAAIGPLLAAGFLLLWPDHLRPLFLMSLLPGLLVVGLVVFGLRETPVTGGGVGSRESGVGKEGPRSSDSSPYSLLPTSYSLISFDRNFRLYLLALVVFTLGNSSDAFLLVRAGELGVATVLLPILWCAFHVFKSLSNLVLGRAVDKFGPRPFIFLGWFAYAGIYLAFALATTAWEAWVFFLAYALFYGLTEPAEKTLVANLVGAERKGMAYGWYNFAIGIATLPASLIFGALYQFYGALVAFGWGAALALVAVVLLMAVRQPSVEIARQ